MRRDPSSVRCGVVANQLAIAPSLTYKWRGKTVTEALPSLAAVRKAEEEIREFRNYQQLSRGLVEVSERVCLGLL
jgi:hypothetical protein